MLRDMIMTRHEELVYDNSTICHICNEDLGEDRVRNHCHLSGKFRGAAHEFCNLKYKVSMFSQLYVTICLAMIVTYLLKHWKIAKVIFLCIPNNEENYISFTKQVIVDKFVNKEGRKVNVKHELRFIDSVRFMASSLDKLSSNLKIDQFVNLKKYYSGNQLSLLLRNSVYPYDYVDCMKKLDETSLPPKEAFIVNSRVKVLQMKTTSMLKQFGRNLILCQ